MYILTIRKTKKFIEWKSRGLTESSLKPNDRRYFRRNWEDGPVVVYSVVGIYPGPLS
jgi:hypothetical protein